MVFQASGKNVKTGSNGADFQELELIKQAENKAVTDIINAKKRAEKVVADTEQQVLDHEQKALSVQAASLEKEYKLGEQKAIEEAKKIKAEGEAEAKQIKDSTQSRMPKAAERIVKSVIKG